MEDVANLAAVAIDGDRIAPQRLDHEMSKPALVLIAELARSIDAAHAQDCRPEPIDPPIVAHILIGGTLGAAIWTVEIEHGVFADAGEKSLADRDISVAAAGHVIPSEQLAIDLVGRGKDHRCLGI